MKKALSLFMGGVIVMSLALAIAAPVGATVNIKNTICHATSAAGNPYVTIKVAEGASLAPHLSDNPGNNPLAGHEQDLLFTGDVDCPTATPSPTPTPTPTPTPVVTPTPTPTPTPVVTPTPTPTPTPIVTPTPTPTPTPTLPPVIGEFDVETCPETGEPVAAGTSVIRIRGGLLLIMLLNVRVDGELVTLRDVFDDGTVGELFVTPGVHNISISNAADTEVLAEGDVFCPECNPAVVTTPPTVPPATLPPTDTVGASDTPGFPAVPLVLAFLVIVSAGALALTPKRRT